MTFDIFYPGDLEKVKKLEKINVHLYGNPENHNIGLFGEYDGPRGKLVLIHDDGGRLTKDEIFTDMIGMRIIFGVFGGIRVPLSKEEIKKYGLRKE